MSRAVGIDLGTTNSVVAVLENGEPTVIANAEGDRTTPSVVAFDKDGAALVGPVARRQAVTNVDRTVKSVKRHVGSSWSMDVGEENYAPQQLLGFVLAKLKRDAEAYLGEDVTSAVVTVPAYFNDAQRQATKEAGEIAGLKVQRILNEPTAAALAYGLDAKDDETILVFDLGGGTFDVSLLAVDRDEEEFSTLQVIATSGDNNLGGDDWDEKLVQLLAQRFADEHGVDLLDDKVARQRLVEAAEAAKVALTSSPSTLVSLPYIALNDTGPVHLEQTITRAEFRHATADLIDRCREPFHQVITDSGLSVTDIDHVVLVGGATRMLEVNELIEELTGKKPNRGVNPDEVVACGAALQAGVLNGERKDVLLVDVTPLTLGIETRGGLMSTVIERNTAIPVRRSQVFTTGVDNQASVKIRIFQGDREMAADNKLLGNFTLTGIPPARRGVPQVEVTFDIDANGIVSVTARDAATGVHQQMVVSGSSALSAEEVERMTQDAAKHAEADRVRRDRAEAANDADGHLYSVTAFLDANPDAVPQMRGEVEKKAAELSRLLADESTPATALRTASANLSKVAQLMGEMLYDAATEAGELFSETVDETTFDPFSPAAATDATDDEPDPGKDPELELDGEEMEDEDDGDDAADAAALLASLAD